MRRTVDTQARAKATQKALSERKSGIRITETQKRAILKSARKRRK